MRSTVFVVMVAVGLVVYPTLAWIGGEVMCPALGLKTPQWLDWFALACVVSLARGLWATGADILRRSDGEGQ